LNHNVWTDIVIVCGKQWLKGFIDQGIPVIKKTCHVFLEFFTWGFPKTSFGQPLAGLTLPKARSALLNAVFGPIAGQKLHNFKDICAFGRAINERGCPNLIFGQPLNLFDRYGRSVNRPDGQAFNIPTVALGL
jgi:hypothetical protein